MACVRARLPTGGLTILLIRPILPPDAQATSILSHKALVIAGRRVLAEKTFGRYFLEKKQAEGLPSPKNDLDIKNL